MANKFMTNPRARKTGQIDAAYSVTKMGMDTNGNHSVWVSFRGGRAKKIQTLYNLPVTHRTREFTPDVADEISDYVHTRKNNPSSTRTSSDVRSPTRTSTKAHTTGNFTATVTGGAGRGANTVVNLYPGARKRNPIVKLHKNIMGTVSFDGLFHGMRKAQDFIIYPMKHETTIARIQSDKRAGYINLETGTVLLSKTQYDFTNVLPVASLSNEELLSLKSAILATASGRAGSRCVFSDNSGAIGAFRGSNPARRGGARQRIKRVLSRTAARRRKNTKKGYYPNPTRELDLALLQAKFLREFGNAMEAVRTPTKFSSKKENDLTRQARLSYAQGMALSAHILGVFTAVKYREILNDLDAARK